MKGILKKKLYKFVISPTLFLLTFLSNKICVFASSTLGENAKNISNTAQQEALGLAEIAGVIGIVVAGICVFIKKADVAKMVFVCTVGGYFILKFAPQIWQIITGGM